MMNREKANARERCRQKSIGNAFNLLRNHLPKQLRDRKPSKAETLKSATQYISHLLRILEKEMANSDEKNQQNTLSPTFFKVDYVYQKGIWIPPTNDNNCFIQDK